jgi:hypothetical protein
LTQINPQDIADDLVRHLDEWYSLPETFDNELDTQIHRWYANAPNVFPKRPYFSPSAADSCSRELYYKAIRAEKDSQRKQPHQGRWQELGTLSGDMIQRTVLAMERNMSEKASFPSRFRFERTKKGEPMFEEFSKRNKKVTHMGHSFYLFGATDGIMEYAHPETGEIIRVGIECKTKQTTAARTSLYSMRQPEEKHVKQCVSYAEMFNVDYFIILYVNASKKAWKYTKEEYEKNPDIRAFGFEVTQEMKDEVFDYFVEILEHVNDMDPPELDPEKFTFNNYKTIIALEMTEEDVEEVRRKKNRAMRSRLPDFKKQAYTECLDFILRVRRERDEQAV